MSALNRHRASLLVVLATLGFVLGAYLLIDQGITTIGRQLRAGDSWLSAILHYLSYLSILANAAAVILYGWYLSGGRLVSAARAPELHAFLTALLLLVGVVWHILLRPSLELTFNNVAMHYGTPALFALWWLVHRPASAPRFLMVHLLMLAPLGYAAWLLAYGGATGRYPYDFIDVGQVGWTATLQMMGGLLLAQWALALAFVTVMRWWLVRQADD